MSLEQELEMCSGLATRPGNRNTFFCIVMEIAVFLWSKMTSAEEVEKKLKSHPCLQRDLNAHLFTQKCFQGVSEGKVFPLQKCQSYSFS